MQKIILIFALITCSVFAVKGQNEEALRNRNNPKPKKDPLKYTSKYVDLSSPVMTGFTKEFEKLSFNCYKEMNRYKKMVTANNTKTLSAEEISFFANETIRMKADEGKLMPILRETAAGISLAEHGQHERVDRPSADA